MTPSQYEEAYYKELDLIREFENRNDISRDSTLIQLSVGLLAVIAAFGKNIIIVNKTLGCITIIMLTLTIVILIIGFITTSKLLSTIRHKMQTNVINGKPFYTDYTATMWQGINTVINMLAFALFMVTILCFSILVVMYIGGLDGK